MSPVKSLEELRKLREEAVQKKEAKAVEGKAHVVVGMGTCGIAAGARETMKAILDVIEQDKLNDIIVTQTGCIGRCEWEPIVSVTVGSGEKVNYGKISPERAKRIMKEHVLGNKVVSDFVMPE